MSSILIRNATVVNEGQSFRTSLLIKDDLIEAIDVNGDLQAPAGARVIEADGLLLLPGIIDDQVHFREPGLTHKADILSESRAAAAGGVTSFMDMPNTVPQTTTIEALNEKYRIASDKSLVNYSFLIGATNNNLSEVLKADPANVPGIKIFMGSSTGDMLVNNENAIRELFRNAHMPVSAHCEDEATIKANTETYRAKYGDNIPFAMHPLIRNREACFRSSSYAVNLAREYNTRLHVFHLSTADEMKLFSNDTPLAEKRITAEVCVHHLWFDDSGYEKLGPLIKWNPAIKTRFDREALRNAVNSDTIDIVATDHAPHTLEEKSGSYLRAPSGGPLIQHSLVAMLEMWHEGIFSVEKIVEKMCHNPAILFNIRQRGFIREGYKADLCLVSPHSPWKVTKENILYKCGWSPFEGTSFRSRVIMTFVNGTPVYDNGVLNENYRGSRLLFDR
jgi:dihydroorotase